jgi:hypothetical protein
MADIKGRTIATTYSKLLYTSTDDGLEGNTGSATSIVTTDDGDGSSTASCLNLGIDRIGIGVVDPDAKLQVQTSNAISNALHPDADEFCLEQAGNAGMTILSQGGIGTIAFGDAEDSNIGRIVYTHSNEKMQFITDTATAITIDSSQNVGIGTSSPENVLNVEGGKVYNHTAGGSENTNDSLASQIVIKDNTTAYNGTPTAGISFMGKYNVGGTDSTFGGITCEKANTNATDSSGVMKFYTTKGSETPVNAMTIDEDGRVGIGTAAPGAIGFTTPKFQVEANNSSAGIGVWRNSNDEDPAYLYLGKSRGTTTGAYTIVQDDDVVGAINFQAADGTDRVEESIASIRGVVWDGSPAANSVGGSLEFLCTSTSGAIGTAKMTILGNGRVGIGTETASTTLDVNGPISIEGGKVREGWLSYTQTSASFGTFATLTITGSSAVYTKMMIEINGSMKRAGGAFANGEIRGTYYVTTGNDQALGIAEVIEEDFGSDASSRFRFVDNGATLAFQIISDGTQTADIWCSIKVLSSNTNSYTLSGI